MPEEAPHTIRLVRAAGTLSVAVEFRERKRLSITVHPDGDVTALAPADRSPTEVARHLEKRLPWIERQLRRFRHNPPAAITKHFISGESHLYLGRQYRLKVAEGPAAQVKLIGGRFLAEVPDPSNPRQVAEALDTWYRKRAEIVFSERLARCAVGMANRLPPDIPLRLRRMKTRWGSCTKEGTVLLNPALIKAPVPCIDYVITHELCHLLIHDHSPAFYRLLSRRMPDWRERKERLDALPG